MLKSMKQPILGICLFYLILASSYAIAVPLWEAPDEPAHFIYADHFARYGQPQPRAAWLPGGWLQNVITGYEWYQPPAYYAFSGLILKMNRTLSFLPPFTDFPTVIATQNRVFAPTIPPITEPHLLRLFSVLLGLGTVLLVFCLSKRIFSKEPWLPELTAGFVAFIPQFMFLHAYITNDTLAIFCTTLGIFGLLNSVVLQSVPERRDWVTAGFASAPAVAVKMTSWFLLPLAAALALINLTKKRRSFVNTIVHFVFYLLSALSLFFISWLLWPDLFERLLGSPNATGIRRDFLIPTHFIDLIPLTHSSFWGRFGWMNLPVPVPLLIPLDSIGLTGLCFGIYASVRSADSFTSNQRNAILIFLLSIIFVLITFLLFNLTTIQPQGRYFYPAISSIGFFVAYGWMALAGKYRKMVVLTILSMMILINIFVLTTVILPAYAPPLG
ncbi:MAG: glycosyltransferase family 39 protein [Caldilineaceae bacterium]